jgi:hypothetical protein
LQCAHCQCFAFFVDASRSRQKQDFLVKSDTKIHDFDALFSFALFCSILLLLNQCILPNLQTKKVIYAEAHADSRQFSLQTRQGK